MSTTRISMRAVQQNPGVKQTINEESDAERILRSKIRKLQIYKSATDYVICVDTHYIESSLTSLL